LDRLNVIQHHMEIKHRCSPPGCMDCYFSTKTNSFKLFIDSAFLDFLHFDGPNQKMCDYTEGFRRIAIPRKEIQIIPYFLF